MKQKDLTKKDVDTFHKKLDKLVHKSFGHSSDEKKKIKNEDLAQMAQKAEMDHEVQMARADLYKLAKYSIKLHELLKNVSEAEGLEGWVQAKITKAADYISSVYHYMDYDEKFNQTELETNIPVQQVVKPSNGKIETYEEVLFKILEKKVTEKKSNKDKK